MSTLRISCALVGAVVLSTSIVEAFTQPHAAAVSTSAPTRQFPSVPFVTINSVYGSTSALSMSGSSTEEKKLPMLLDPGTKGGALFLSLVLFILPIIGYEIVTLGFGFDEIEAGRWIGVGFTLVTLVLWVSTYIFRVATKDMTYAKQLKDYENAVIAKRLEELDEDEVQALVEDIERDDF